jgi:hypothetical protein
MAVTANDVAEIFDTELQDSQIQRHLDVAERLVNRELDGRDQQEKDDVTLYLAAHFAATQEPRAESASVGDASVTYQGDSEMGFKSTRYGQQALMLDPTGNLENLADGNKAASLTFYSRADDQ